MFVEYCINERSKGMKGGLLREKDFKDSQVADINAFLDTTLNFPYMLDLKGTIEKCVDLSDLWFKEFYLEITRQIQFPISMSLPWILAETVLESDNPETLGNIFTVFDLYNDAANAALFRLKSKFIYDEIVAEVNLCFDQLIFKISQRIFSHFKKYATNLLLSTDIRPDSTSLDASRDSPLGLFDIILSQTNFQLLGRSINVNRVLSEMMNEYLRKSIDVSICRFEVAPIHAIKDLENLFECNRLTHALLSRKLTLDPFDDIVDEVNENVSLSIQGGRITMHVMQELIDDFIPNSAFNQISNRFVPSTVPIVDPIIRIPQSRVPAMYLYGSKTLFASYTQLLSIYGNYFGDAHFQAIVKLAGINGILFIVQELQGHVDMLLQNTLTTYINVIEKGIPSGLKLPVQEYGVEGAYEYFSAHFKPLIKYQDLQTEIFQTFREIGNIVVIVNGLQTAVNLQSSMSKIQTRSLFGGMFTMFC
jgi:cytoplasmic FMR1 interacting protein